MSSRRKVTVKCKKVLHPVSSSRTRIASHFHHSMGTEGQVPGRPDSDGDGNSDAGSSCTAVNAPADYCNPFYKLYLGMKNSSPGARFCEREFAQVLAEKFEAACRDEKGNQDLNVFYNSFAKDLVDFRDILAEDTQMTKGNIESICYEITNHLYPAEVEAWMEYDCSQNPFGPCSFAGAAGCMCECAEEAVEDEGEGDDCDYVDVNDSEEDDEPIVSCDKCLPNKCSNCLVTIKKGEKKHSKIPSAHHIFDDLDYVSLEVALVCVFDSDGPFQKWNRTIENDAEILMQQAKQGKLKKSSVSNDNVKEPEAFEYGDKEEEAPPEVTKEKCYEASSNPSSKLNKNEEANNLKKGQSIVEIDEKKYSKNYYTTRMIADTIWTNGEDLRDFYLCSGCAELLSILYSLWERLEMNLLAEDMYFHTVMMAFGVAEKARSVIYNPPKGSKFRVLRRYSKKCHPVGCQRRTTQNGARIDLGSGSVEDLIKQAVGNLISYLHEAYSRVCNELLNELFC